MKKQTKKTKRPLIIVNVYYISHFWDSGDFNITHVVRYKEDLINLFIQYDYPFNFAQIREIFSRKFAVVDIYVKKKGQDK